MAIKKYYVTVDEESTTRWYKDAKCKVLHRENGPAIEYANSDKFWLQNGQLHRTDGPAIERANGHKAWYQNNQLHRTDGPAVEYADGNKEWWLKGVQYTEQGYHAQLKTLGHTV